MELFLLWCTRVDELLNSIEMSCEEINVAEM